MTYAAETMRAVAALRDFGAALAATPIGPRIRFGDRVNINAGDLSAAVLGELELHDFGDPERREHMVEQIVQRIFRDSQREQ